MSACRASGFNKTAVDRFFENLRLMYQKYHFTGDCVFNMDESGISNVPTKMEKVVSTKGKKTVSKIVSAEKGETVTIVCAMSPCGFHIPPAIIIPRVRHHPKFYVGAPINTLELNHSTGFMTSELFLLWLKHFQKYARPTKESPVLLILDNHSSHRTIGALMFCREHDIHLLSLPPHCSQKLQPLDVVFFSPLKNRYSTALDNFLTNRGKSESRLVSMEKVASLFKNAYNEVASLEKGTSGFETTGIWPYNPQKFTNIHFAPSTVSDRPLCTEDEDVVYDDLEPAIPPVSSSRTVLFPSLDRSTEDLAKALDVTEDEHPALNTGLSTPCKQPRTVSSTPISTSTPIKIVISTSTSTPIKIVSPSTILLSRPKRIRKVSNQTRKSQRSEALTESPFKNQLLKEVQAKETRQKNLEEKKKEIKEKKKEIQQEKLAVKASEKEKKITEKKGRKEKLSQETGLPKNKKLKFNQKDNETEQSLPLYNNDENAECLFCNEPYLNSREGDDWIQCVSCDRWAHTACADIPASSQTYLCDVCN